MDKREEIRVTAENGEELRENAARAGEVIAAAEQEGPYFMGVIDGLLNRTEAIKSNLARPGVTV